MHAKSLVLSLCNPWITALQAPVSMGFSRQDTGVRCHVLLQGIFLIQGLSLCLLCLLHCRWILYHQDSLAIRKAPPVDIMGKNPPVNAEDVTDVVQSLGLEGPLEEGMATHSIIFAWRISWTEQPGQLQSLGLQRLGHD